MGRERTSTGRRLLREHPWHGIDRRGATTDLRITEALSRQDVAKETFDSIENQVAEYYFEIHPQGTPDDATGAPSIDVERHGKGTAFVRGRFYGREVKDPQWVYSDGHLDTVGICIFLALRRFRSEQPDDPRLMVLDDIVISIDLGHARRLITLLKTSSRTIRSSS